MQVTYKIENLVKELTETVKSEKAGIAIFITDKQQVCGSISCDGLDLLDFAAFAVKTIGHDVGLSDRKIFKAIKARKEIIGDGLPDA